MLPDIKGTSEAIYVTDKKYYINTVLQLLPFFKTLALYFVLFIPSDEASFYAAFIKCLPIISLQVFILLHGFGSKNEAKSNYRKNIFYGLTFSCLGDFLLVWPNLFIFGMVAFGVGHIFYIRAFGMKPLKLFIGVFLYAVATVMNLVLSPGLYGALIYGVPIYSYLLATMTWRTLARLSYSQKENLHWVRILTGIGGVLWLLSDTFLALHHFHSPLHYSQVLIMVTYYLGQLGVALSILEFNEDPPKHDKLKCK